jgi:hypothetical protein
MGFFLMVISYANLCKDKNTFYVQFSFVFYNHFCLYFDHGKKRDRKTL